MSKIHGRSADRRRCRASHLVRRRAGTRSRGRSQTVRPADRDFADGRNSARRSHGSRRSIPQRLPAVRAVAASFHEAVQRRRSCNRQPNRPRNRFQPKSRPSRRAEPAPGARIVMRTSDAPYRPMIAGRAAGAGASSPLSTLVLCSCQADCPAAGSGIPPSAAQARHGSPQRWPWLRRWQFRWVSLPCGHATIGDSD